MRSCTNCSFGNIFFVPTEKIKECERNTKKSNPHGFELYTSSIKGTKLLIKVIKIIIIMARFLPVCVSVTVPLSISVCT